MARPTKVGIDYFPLDCHMEEKIRLIQAEFGLKGFAIVVKLYQKIYGELGYYCEWNEDSSLLFMSENGVSSRDEKNLIEEIVRACIRRHIFSETLFHKYGVLTSAGVQRRYLESVSRRESVELKKEYLLISVPQNAVNVVINSVNVCNNSVNVCNNTQSKVKESRVKESKVEYKQITDLFNYTCVSFPRVITISDKRKQTIKKLCQIYSLNQIKEVFEKAEQSKFLKGENNRGWSANFDWLLEERNFIKVLEGNYADRKDTDKTKDKKSSYDLEDFEKYSLQ